MLQFFVACSDVSKKFTVVLVEFKQQKVRFHYLLSLRINLDHFVLNQQTIIISQHVCQYSFACAMNT